MADTGISLPRELFGNQRLYRMDIIPRLEATHSVLPNRILGTCPFGHSPEPLILAGTPCTDWRLPAPGGWSKVNGCFRRSYEEVVVFSLPAAGRRACSPNGFLGSCRPNQLCPRGSNQLCDCSSHACSSSSALNGRSGSGAAREFSRA